MCLTSSRQAAGMAKCCPQSQTDITFVAMDARVVRTFEDDLIATRDVLPCRVLARLI